jgi:hypothetical protein
MSCAEDNLLLLVADHVGPSWLRRVATWQVCLYAVVILPCCRLLCAIDQCVLAAIARCAGGCIFKRGHRGAARAAASVAQLFCWCAGKCYSTLICVDSAAAVRIIWRTTHGRSGITT